LASLWRIEDRGLKSEDRGQRSEDRSRRIKDGGLKMKNEEGKISLPACR
jgi:hypothetical protein